MPLSGDERKREIQLENLKKSTRHGAYSPALTRRHRKRFVAELTAAFPNATRAELTVQATRLARLELLGAFLDDHGVIRNRRTGDVYAAASLEAQISSAFERQHAALLEREKTRSQPESIIAGWQRQLPRPPAVDSDGR